MFGPALKICALSLWNTTSKFGKQGQKYAYIFETRLALTVCDL